MRERPWPISRIQLLGVPIDRVSLIEALHRVEEWIHQRKGTRLVLTPDTTVLMRACWDELLRSAYRQADLVTPDGIGLVWASRFLGAPLPERVTGIDLFEALCERGSHRSYRVFLLGSKPGVAQAAADKLKERFPGLQVVGVHHGYFSSEENGSVLQEIHKAAPDVLFVGMGVPRQERWMLQNRERLGVPAVLGVGGSFDVLSGWLPRAPLAWRKLGLEWLWRALREPHRLWRLRVIPIFLGKIIFYRFLQLHS